jgi:hypothetical protein
MTAGGRRRGALEQEVLAYTTVMTALGRLHAEGALTPEPAGRAFACPLPGDATSSAAPAC